MMLKITGINYILKYILYKWLNGSNISQYYFLYCIFDKFLDPFSFNNI